MRVLIVLALALAAVSAAPKTTREFQRIVGGEVTSIESYPSMASMLLSWGNWAHRQTCGGAVLNQRTILSAAHCYIFLGDLDPVSYWRVRLGSTTANSGGTVYDVGRIIPHESYNANTYENDVCILHLSSNAVYGAAVQAAGIAGANYNLPDNRPVWATGWGTTSPGGFASEQLRHVQVYTINQEICTSRYASGGYLVTAGMLCTGVLDVGGRDQCQGDSGGPVYDGDVIVGVCSWGVSCAHAFYPGVNARVSYYSSWIVANAM